MSLTTLLFHGSALSVLPFWGLMLFAPTWSFSRRVLRSPWILLPPVLCYLFLAGAHLPELLAVFRAPSPESLGAAMAKPWGASLYWTYAGAFDLFVGQWIYHDAQRHQLGHGWIVLPLLLAIFLGPVGWTLYLAIRTWRVGSQNVHLTGERH